MRKQIALLKGLLLGGGLFVAQAADRTSSSYTVPRDTIDAGGGLSHGATFSYTAAGSLRSMGGLPALDSGALIPSLPIHEPFQHPVGLLIGRTTPGGWTWLEAGPAGPEQPTVGAGALSYVGLAYAPSNRIEMRAGSGPSAKLPFADASVAIGGSGGPLNSGILFFSFVLRVRDPSGLSMDGDYFAALTPSPLPESDTPSEAFVRVLLRPATGGYNVGVVKSSSDPADFLWDPRLWDTNVNVFIVGAYTFEPGADDDVAKVWVCPAGVSFCDSALAPTLLTSSVGPDATALGSFVYFQRPAPKLPAVLWSDELRIGTSWLDVVEPGEDWGDAPSPPYPTLASDNGASHTVVPGIHLGTWIDIECDGNPSGGATGDDTSSLSDEDGLLTKTFPRGLPTLFSVEASCGGFLNVWMDLDHDGNWLGPDEHVFVDAPLVAGRNDLPLTLPSTAYLGYTMARLRFSTTGGLAPTGHADDGEVEDYRAEIIPGLESVVAAPVIDINPGTVSSKPGPFMALNAVVFFAASSREFNGEDIELWKSDGTPGGTVRVKDINPGPASSSPANLVLMGDMLYFTATDGTTGVELWKSDGTEAGTQLVKDIFAAGGSSAPASLTVAENTLFFSANDNLLGRELWRSDGTEAGTVCVKNIVAGNGSSTPQALCPIELLGCSLLFAATDGENGIELWKTDGTEAGTTLVKDIRPGAGSSQPLNLTLLGNTVFFRTDDGTAGRELWKSDGTGEGTVMVKDILPGSGDSTPGNLTVVGPTLYFVANDGSTGNELWKSDGTEAGTQRVKDIFVGGGSSALDFLTSVDQTLFFRAADNSTGRELWKSDGSEAGTQRVKDIAPGSPSSDPHALAALGNTLFFAADDGIHGIELWKSDGTEAGTVQVFDIRAGAVSSSPDFLLAVGDTVFFSAYASTTGAELWTSDGTTEGTALVRDINQEPQSSNPQYPCAVGELTMGGNDEVYYVADDGFHGAELWKFDGIGAGTMLVKDIFVGGLSSNPHDLCAVGNTLLFAAADGVHGNELWLSDGTPGGTVLVKDVWAGTHSSELTELTPVGSTVFFRANGNIGTGTELWKSDGTELGTVQVKDIHLGGTSSTPEFLTCVGSTLFFTATTSTYGEELWKSDGTEAGTVLVKDIKPGPDRSTPQLLTAVGNRLFFRAMDTVGSTDYELWVSDGSEAGTYRVKDIWPGLNASNPTDLTATDDTLYCIADDGEHGRELWKSDGTEAGTVMVQDIRPNLNAEAAYLTAVGSWLYFSANDGISGHELWTSDGTEAGTILVKDIWPGGSSSRPKFITAAGNRVFFSASDGIAGEELWTSDGTEAGSVLVGDIFAGSTGSFPSNFVAVGNTLLFTATDPNTGTELWSAIPVSEAEVDLQVTMTPESSDADEGDRFRVVVEIRNGGPQTAAGVQLECLNLPEIIRPVSVTSSLGSCQIVDHTVNCDLGSLAPQQTAVVMIDLNLEMEGTLILLATASSSNAELTPGDNSAQSIVTVYPCDYGDALDSHQTLRTSNGPHHRLRPGWSLGALVDADPDGMPSANADGDDVGDGTDDEDAIVFLTPMIAGLISQVEVAVTLPPGSNGFLNAWVDFNGNGRFSTGLEHAMVDVPVTSGVSTQDFLVPVGVSSGPACARFRLSAVPGISFEGPTSAGEVEDYQVTLETNVAEIVWVRNPTSGIDLYCHIHRPADFDPNKIYPGLMLVPGGITPGTSLDTGYRAQRYADLGFIVMHFDADGRGLSTDGGSYTNQDCNGFLQQDGLRAVLQHLADLPETDDLNIGIFSSSYGISMAFGVLARYPHNPGVKFLLDWEGPANRTHILGGAIAHDPLDDPWWAEREATGFISDFQGYYLRVQTEADHVQTNNDHAILLVNLATHTQHGGEGRCVWTRVNSASGVTTNDPNNVYLPPAEPQWIAEDVPNEPLIHQYLLELAAMPPLAGPVRVIFDLHMDPMFSIPESNRLDVYGLRRDAAIWALDQCDLRGARVTFLGGGEFYEYVRDDIGLGDALLLRAFNSGGSIGTHMHREIQNGPHDWSELPGGPPLSAIRTAWEDHIDLANTAIARALGLSTPEEIRAVNNIFGTHIPNDPAMRLDLMEDYGFAMHQQGPEEEFYGYFQHHAMNPFRPAHDNFLKHDPNGPMVLSPFGPVLGRSETHYGIAQDMRVPAVQARFLLEMLNWLHDVHVAGSGRVWTMGWAAHGYDLTPGQPTRAALPLMLDWLKNEFVDQTVGGYQGAAFSSAAECRDLYEAWETVHPAEASFTYPASTTDWTLYPYLRAPAAYLADALYDSPMPPFASVRWHALAAAPASASPFTVYVAYSTDGLPITVDLSAYLAMPTIAAVDTETGVASVVPASMVPVPPQGVILVPTGRVLTLRLDMGDAPAGYPVLLADDGARHDASSLHFGIEWDAELEGQPSPNADRDDLTGPTDDEDGVTLPPSLVPGTAASVTVQITGGTGVLDAWIDWNRDLDWDDPGEHVLVAEAVASGAVTLPISVPADAAFGPTAVRFRLSTAGMPLPTGYAADGEVEDAVVLLTTDQTPPVLACPDRVMQRATSRTGLFVTYSVTATDNEDPAPLIICIPPSGSIFPLGTTMVNCTAQDAAGSVAHCAFPVEVKELEAGAIPGGLMLYWDISDAVLEEADTLDGPWTTVPEARSPLSVPVTDHSKFYRLRYLEGARLFKVEPSIVPSDDPVGTQVCLFGLNIGSNYLMRVDGVVLASQ